MSDTVPPRGKPLTPGEKRDWDFIVLDRQIVALHLALHSYGRDACTVMVGEIDEAIASTYRLLQRVVMRIRDERPRYDALVRGAAAAVEDARSAHPGLSGTSDRDTFTADESQR